MVSVRLVSLFSGCGGLDLGFEEAGFTIKVAVEKEKWACETLRLNFRNTIVIGPPTHIGDVNSLNGEELLEKAGMKVGEVDLVVGGPPCQSFSVAAAQRFLKGDTNYENWLQRPTKRKSGF